MCSFKSREDHNNKAINRALLACCLIVPDQFNYPWSSISSLPPTDRQTYRQTDRHPTLCWRREDTALVACPSGTSERQWSAADLGSSSSLVRIPCLHSPQKPQLSLSQITCFPKLLCWDHSTSLLWTSSPSALHQCWAMPSLVAPLGHWRDVNKRLWHWEGQISSEQVTTGTRGCH